MDGLGQGVIIGLRLDTWVTVIQWSLVLLAGFLIVRHTVGREKEASSAKDNSSLQNAQPASMLKSRTPH